MEHKDVIKAMRETLSKVAPNSEAYLFGSRARGDAREDSDWDILILLDKARITNADQDEVAYPLSELGWNINEVINPVLFTKDYWNSHSFTPFHHNVVNEGIKL